MRTVVFFSGLFLIVAPVIAADWSDATVRYRARTWGGYVAIVGFVLAFWAIGCG